MIYRSLVWMRGVAVWIVQVEVAENYAHSFAIVAIETVSAYDVRRIPGRETVVRRRNRPRLALIGADQV